MQWLSKNPKLIQPKAFETNEKVLNYPAIDFCLPSSCRAEDIRRAISEFVGQEVIFSYKDAFNFTRRYSIATYAGDDWCYTRQTVDAPPNFDGPDIAVMYLIYYLNLKS